MDYPKNDNSAAASGYGVQIVRINGPRIRAIREEKGLTQLYLSEVVGVTTDTISRWENRRYPSIKKENARNLARALEVELEEILEKEQDEAADEMPPPPPAIKKKPSPRLVIGLALIIVVAGILSVVALRLFSGSGPTGTIVSANRILPPHVPPGQTFPVLIRVDNPGETSTVLILKESFPPGTTVETGEPPFTTIDPKKHDLKWISRTENRQAVFAYLVRAPVDAVDSRQLVFTGSVTLKQETDSHKEIAGNASLTIAPYHWADSNSDGMIDDEEILAVYDLYGTIPEIDFNRDLIDDIWASSGYKWDEERGQYVVLD